MEATLHAEPGKPVLTVCSTTSHGSQQDAVDLNDLLYGLRGDPVASGGSGVGRNDDAALETESERGGSVGDLNGAVGV